MPRLTNSMRDTIVHRVMHYKFKDEAAALHIEEQAVFDQVLDHVQGADKKKIEALPLSYFHTTASFTIRHAGTGRHNSRNSVTINGGHPRATKEGSGLRHYSTAEVKTLTEEGYKLAIAYADKYVEYLDRRHELESKLKALLASMTSTKKLYEVWPELAAIVPEPRENVSSTGTALTVSVAELNKLIPLPPEAPSVAPAAKKAIKKTARKR